MRVSWVVTCQAFSFFLFYFLLRVMRGRGDNVVRGTNFWTKGGRRVEGLDS